MGVTFDPYREWLGVRETARPLNHYQLLGIAPGEADPARVEAAFEERSARLQEHTAGENSRVARRTLFEIESAKQCLLDPDTRAAYDDGLRQQGVAIAAPASAPASVDDELSLKPIDEKPRARATTQAPAKKPAPAQPALTQPATQPVRSVKAPSAGPVPKAVAAPKGVAAPKADDPILTPLDDDLEALDSEPAAPIRKSARVLREEKEARRKQMLLVGGGVGFLVLCVGLFVGIRSLRQIASAEPPVEVAQPATPGTPAGGVLAPVVIGGEPAPVPVATQPVVPPKADPPTPAPYVPSAQPLPPVNPVPTPTPTPWQTSGKTPPPNSAPPGAGFQPNTGFPPAAGFPPGDPINGAPAKTVPRVPPRLPRPPVDPAAEPGPFASFPRNVELPQLVGGAFGKLVPLGKITLDRDEKLRLDLRDAVEGDKQGVQFRLEAEPGDLQQWTVVATPPKKKAEDETPDRFRVAKFSLSPDGILEFAWLDEAVSIAASSLRNCVLELGALGPGDKLPSAERALGLRCAQVAAFNRLDPTKDEITIPLKGEAIPVRAALRLQMVEVKGFPSETTMPDGFTAAFKEELKLIVRFATVKTPGVELRMRLESGVSGSVLKINAVAVDAKGETLPFSQERVEQMAGTVPRELRDGKAELIGMENEYLAIENQIRILANTVASDINEQGKINFNIATLRKRLAKSTDNIVAKRKKLVFLAWLDSIIPELAGTSRDLHSGAQFDYRVYFVVSGREVDVLTTR